MPTQVYNKKHIALMQLETALRLYFERQDYFSVITLAGVAQEIFGKLLTARGIENSLESTKKAVSAIHQHLFGTPLSASQVADRFNYARNAVKHWSVGQSLTVELDLVEEAKQKLDNAISDYWLLEAQLTPAMERFQRKIVAA